MSRAELKKLLIQLRRMPDATPAAMLAEFRRLLAESKAKVRRH
jgi:hypothetical protein